MQISKDIHKTLSNWFDSWGKDLKKGTAWTDLHLSRSMHLVTIGTDPDEWMQGVKAFGHMDREMRGTTRFQFRPGEIQAFEEGSVGWAAARPTIVFASGKLVPLRISAVFHREEGEWKMVHCHVSVGVPNEELFKK
jgi:ketosteroid isomerase-like protein